ncbi:MAG TPA: SusC/RagA family TonB-linked outer membrane protein [Gemmatimonadales bacterium]|jgi:TonB-linked SusC/RagA family outer membrane protein|nr:SusC/RagA family TonB-linked outer membrane protein [Gemmatimonadales bacterium]
MTDNRWIVRSLLTIGLVLIGLIPAAASAQEATTVSGQVKTSAGGTPLVGVIVSVPSLRVSATTDNGGNYRLVLPAGTTGPLTLTARRIGYQTGTVQVDLSGPTVTQDIALVEGAIELQGVVVTALGIEREKGSLTYAAQSLNGEKLSDVPTQNVVSALQGNVAGVQVTNSANPFGSARIVVRGSSSILGQNQPLIIVDGIPIDNSAASNTGYGGGSLGGYDVGNAASDISADNVASVTVLKGPNAAALYGSRAANGAIVYTTKSGKGAPQQGFGVTATFGANMETPLRLPNYQNRYGQGFYGEFDFVDGNFGGINDGADESWGPKMDGRTTGCVRVAGPLPGIGQANNYDASAPCNQFFGAGPWVAHPNNVRDFWETGLIVNANVAVARSSDRSNVRLSVGRTNESGMYPNNTNNRTDIALSGGTQVSDHWSAEASVNYINDGMKNQPSQAYEEIDPMQGFIWFGRQVDTRLLKQNIFRDPNDAFTQQILIGNPLMRTDAPIPYSWNYSYHPNPYWMAGVKTTDYSRNRGLGHASVTYKVNDWISVTGRTGRDWYQNQFRANYPVNDISPFYQGGFLDVGETRSETNNDFLVTANRQLTPTLALTVNAGGNQRKNDFNTNVGLVSELVIPGVYTLANSNGQPFTQLFQTHKKVNSLYGSANFNYKDWLNVDITGRNDWSSTLPKNANSLFYPSVGAAFIFTDALGLQSSWLSYGKVRASWTRVGNDTDPYQLAAVYGAGTAWAGSPSFTAPDRLPNSTLKPEQTTGQEIGADLGFFRDRLILNATVYQKNTTNQILPVSISAATGYSSAVVNSGEVRNRGIELAATMTPIERPDFRWNVVVNWSKNSNKVLSLYSGVSRIVVGNYWNVNVTADTGQPYGNLVGYKWQRDAQGHIVVGDDGLPLRNPTQQVLGNYNPDWVGGISNTISYKRMSFSFSFDGQMGGQVYSVTKWFGQYSGVLANTLAGRELDWNNPGYIVPNAVYANGQPDTTHVLAQDYWHNTFYAQEPGIFNATYFKLREARLAYALPTRVAQFLGFSDATVAIVGRNLLLFAKQPTIDPETAFDTSNRQGVENGQLPTARSIGFTMSVRP